MVTGASSGIGREVAISFADAGARVLLAGRDVRRLDDAADLITGRGGEGRTVAADFVDDPAAVDAVTAEAVNCFGGLDILVHSAGIYERMLFDRVTRAHLDDQWKINFRAPFLLSQALLPHIRSGGSVIFISSVAADVSIPNASVYCATKAALNALAGVLAIELAPRDIRVNVVAPGFTATAMNERLRRDPKIVNFVLATTPARRLGTVEDVAPVVVFLASDAAKFIQGEVVRVDGGYPTPFAMGRTPPEPGE